MCWRGQDCLRWVLVSTGEERIQLCDLWSCHRVRGRVHGNTWRHYWDVHPQRLGRLWKIFIFCRDNQQEASKKRLKASSAHLTLKGSVRWTTQTSVRFCCFYISLIYCIYNFVDNTNSIKSEKKTFYLWWTITMCNVNNNVNMECCRSVVPNLSWIWCWSDVDS